MAQKTVQLAAYTTDLKQTQIRHKLTEVSHKRKAENAYQKNAYKKLLDYIKKRADDERITPGQKEIQVLEVFKKLVESGWIVRQPEIVKIF